VCPEVEHLAEGADLLVHEACRTSALADLVRGTDFEKIFGYHADTVLLGGPAQRAGDAHRANPSDSAPGGRGRRGGV
jgi:ribonuclease Z